MQQTLPEWSVAILGQLAGGLEAWAGAHPGASLAEVEQATLEQVRAALPALLAGLVRRVSPSLAAGARRLKEACPGCGRRQRVQSWRPRQGQTVCGTLRFERPWYTCPRCRHGWSPTDQQLGLGAQERLSVGLRAWLADEGQATSFAEAAERIARLSGVAVAAETVRQHSEAQGTELAVALEAAAERVQAAQVAAEAVEPAPGRLVVEVDGVMVRYLTGWHEVKLGVVGGQVGRHLVAASYVAARASPEQFGPQVLAEAARRGALDVVAWEQPPGTDARLELGAHLAVLREVVVLADGAVWIWHLAAEHFGERIEVVDSYHATQHVWAIANACYGEGSAKAKRWGERQGRRLLERGPEPLLRALRLARPGRPEVAEVVRRERGYFTTNAARMDYPTFRAQGLPIGSGAVEGSARHLVQRRMKLPGARWSEPGARAILALRAHRLSGRPLPLTA